MSDILSDPAANGQQKPHFQYLSMSDLSERALRAAQITAQPQRFKVCEGCESIVTIQANTCPNCHGYRFDEDPQRVISQAKLLGSRPQTSVKPDDLL